MKSGNTELILDELTVIAQSVDTVIQQFSDNGITVSILRQIAEIQTKLRKVNSMFADKHIRDVLLKQHSQSSNSATDGFMKAIRYRRLGGS